MWRCAARLLVFDVSKDRRAFVFKRQAVPLQSSLGPVTVQWNPITDGSDLILITL